MSLKRVKKIKIVRNKLILNAGVFKHYINIVKILLDSNVFKFSLYVDCGQPNKMFIMLLRRLQLQYMLLE